MTTFTLAVELWVSGAWLDITKIDDETKVLREGSLSITRGRSDKQGRVAPTEVRFTYLDSNGLLDGGNPASPYYRLIGLGTLMRVKVDGDVRAVVEIVSWEPSWDEIDEVVKVEVVGGGLLRRIEDGQKPLSSPAYRALTSPVNDGERVIYLPFEEESDATMISSPYSGARVHWTGTINFGAIGDSPTSARLLTFGPASETQNTHLFVNLDPWDNSAGQHLVSATLRFPETELDDLTVVYCMYFTGGTVDKIHFLYQTGGNLSMQTITNGAITDTVCSSNFGAYILGQEVTLIITADQNGADIDFRIRITNDTSHLVTVSDSTAGKTLGRMWAITISQTSCEGLGFGQLAVGNSITAFGNYHDDLDATDQVVTGARGYLGERAGNRIERLADEEDIPISVSGDADNTERLSAQAMDTATGLVFAAADTDLGILFEPRDALELTYRTHANLYNQAPTASLDYSHLSKGLRLPTDDLRVTNAVTTQRDGGGTAYYTIPDGDWWHWSTEDPPDGAGVRESEDTVDVTGDGQLASQAAWRAHLGSWRERRFRQVVLELARSAFTGGDRTAVMALDIGDVLAIDMTDAPPYVPYDEIRLMVQGYTETVSRELYTININTTPADLYEVGVVDAAESTLVVAIDSDDTSVKLAVGLGPEWSTTDEPYHIEVDGDPMTVTTITTDTPAFIAAGTAAHAANGGDVTPSLPAGITANVGQLLLAFVAIRNSGAGTVDEHPSWTTLCDVPSANIKVFYRYYVTGVTNPTFGFTGDAAGADTSAQICAFSGLSHEFASGTKATPAFAAQLNGSAQDIAFPAIEVQRPGVRFWLGWKQDDWTSVATVTGADAEIGEPDVVTGDDQGIVWDYDIDATGTDISSGSFVVTGGAAAISRSIVFALRPLQTATVTRGIAGVATSASAGDAVHVWRPGVVGL